MKYVTNSTDDHGMLHIEEYNHRVLLDGGGYIDRSKTLCGIDMKFEHWFNKPENASIVYVVPVCKKCLRIARAAQ